MKPRRWLEKNAIDNLAPLATAGIPVVHVVGDADDVVPVKENTAIVEARLPANGWRNQSAPQAECGATIATA